ncbi:hypothetical protein [Streptomyces sp. NPDC058295]
MDHARALRVAPPGSCPTRLTGDPAEAVPGGRVPGDPVDAPSAI